MEIRNQICILLITSTEDRTRDSQDPTPCKHEDASAPPFCQHVSKTMVFQGARNKSWSLVEEGCLILAQWQPKPRRTSKQAPLWPGCHITLFPNRKSQSPNSASTSKVRFAGSIGPPHQWARCLTWLMMLAEFELQRGDMTLWV